ncbi:MAG TPA: XdhC family protein [Actinocrinis sp.]|jgi:xanthine dehydrogenase accessory factor|uniref:XdhC family protein n=1 Tax=Actinocrinis sp. TaxID=1920516 RepID=UPI002DDDABCB|nr:XdhC family protein [Actinocrinis sp.]HEV3173327.1 XdhC family protein [Actinocrinis sp.]
MHDIAERLQSWHADRRPFAVASVVGVTGSAPRGPGAAMAVDVAGEAVGSLSGGCVEGAVYELCREAIASGKPVLESFGFLGDDALAVGLTCGGALDVFIQPVQTDADPAIGTAIACITSGTPVALVRAIAGPTALLGTSIAVTADDHIGGSDALLPTRVRGLVAEARAMLDAGRTGTLALDSEVCAPSAPTESKRIGEAEESVATFFIESYTPAPRMLVFGAIDFASAVVRIGKFLGYHVTLCDARAVFATRRRFPEADDVVVQWPHRYLDSQLDRIDGRTVLCVLTHDAKFDIPLLERALRLPVAYVGAMGSRRTRRDRDAALRGLGLTDAELARLHSPIGLDLGARTPEETAIAVAAEIVALRRGGGCRPLSSHQGPIHHEPSVLSRAVIRVPAARSVPAPEPEPVP